MSSVHNRPRRALAVAACASLTLGLGAIMPTAQAAPNDAPSIIPALQSWSGGEGRFTLTTASRIVVDAELRGVGEQLADDLAAVIGFDLSVATGAPAAGDVVLDLDAALTDTDGGERFDEEGYTLTATASRLTVAAPSEQGAFYGTRTLLQGLVQSPGRTSFPAGETSDWPDYETRGFSLDVGRRFFTPEFIRDYISMMSWYKLNEFQIHLNDNQIPRPSTGWKDGYAGFRLKSDDPAFAGLASEDGAYDRDDWRSFEDVAATHGVQIVPEIDVPAHSLAFIHWKPELGLNGGDSDHLDLTKPATTEVIKDIFDEFVPWFEGPEVHYGADEYPKSHADEYRTFFNDMAGHVRSLGKHPRAWGSMSVMHGSADGYDRDVTISAWNDGWYGMGSAEADGYEYINMNDATLYVVPFADYYHGKGLNNQGLYTSWLPNRLWNTDTVAPGAPRGAMFAVWNDLVDADYTELDVHGLIRDSFPVIAQKSWKAESPSLSYAEFSEVRDALGSGPGVSLIESARAAAPGDLTADATVTASADDAEHPATNLLDGLAYSRWQATGDASFTIDLGANRTVGSVRVDWAQPAPASFDVEVSNDGEHWRTVAADVDGASSEVTFAADSARYVRISAAADGATVGAWSAQVFAPAPLTAGATVTASGSESADFPPALVVDGNLTTRWSANYVDQPWIQLDLGAAETFSRVDLAWEAASATAYRIDVSDDGLTWREAASRSGLATGTRTDIVEFDETTARHVRVTVTGKSMSPYLSLYEVTIPAPEVEPPVPPSPSPTAEPTPTPTPEPTPTATPTGTPKPTPTARPTPSVKPTPSAKPTASPSAKPTTKPGQVDVYSTPGVHFVGGRQWWTECEKYSQTTRCTTRIYATQVSQVNGRFVQTNDWVFNNLTYLPQMTRQQWKGNPLGSTGSWTDASGRGWRTECDTAVTGRNGCRTYAEADVIAAVTVNGVRGYRWETRMVLNNIVRFR